MGQLHFACIRLKDKNEIAIIQQYGWKAKCYTVVLTGKTLHFYASLIIYSIYDIYFIGKSIPTDHRIIYVMYISNINLNYILNKIM